MGHWLTHVTDTPYYATLSFFSKLYCNVQAEMNLIWLLNLILEADNYHDNLITINLEYFSNSKVNHLGLKVKNVNFSA